LGLVVGVIAPVQQRRHAALGVVHAEGVVDPVGHRLGCRIQMLLQVQVKRHQLGLIELTGTAAIGDMPQRLQTASLVQRRRRIGSSVVAVMVGFALLVPRPQYRPIARSGSLPGVRAPMSSDGQGATGLYGKPLVLRCALSAILPLRGLHGLAKRSSCTLLTSLPTVRTQHLGNQDRSTAPSSFDARAIAEAAARAGRSRASSSRTSRPCIGYVPRGWASAQRCPIRAHAQQPAYLEPGYCDGGCWMPIGR
jgi:hypothetical protein